MNKKAFVIFISIVISVYSLVNYYVFIHGYNALPDSCIYKTIYITLFSFVFISYILFRVLRSYSLYKVSEFLTWVGSFWLGAMFYFFLIILFFDIIDFLNIYLKIIPSDLFAPHNNASQLIGGISVIIVLILMIFGFFNARKPILKRIRINIPKKADIITELNIVAVSDIHIGMFIKHRMVKRLVRIINKQKPDIVLFVGDIIDEDLKTVLKYDLGAPLKSINSQMGVFAVTGNHEYIGGKNNSVKYIESLGIKVLQDEVIKINNAFFIAGRNDKDMFRFTGKNRMNLTELIKDIKPDVPLILIDHQPFNFHEVQKCGVDLQISGHTHNGQIWPLNYIIKTIFNLSKGYKKIDNSHFFVSSGFGTWGPPIRIGNKPEVVNIIIAFRN